MYSFRKAETEAELEQVFRLNHEVFAGELRQHHTNTHGILVDKFHDKNSYLIAMAHQQVIGMLTYHDQPVVRTIVREAAASSYKFSSLILGIVHSAPFQMRTKAKPSGT